MDFVADMFKVFLFVQIAVHHKEQGERREVGSVRRLYIGAMFPQPETATAVKADAPCGYVGSGRLHFQHDGLSGVPDESVEDASSQPAAAQGGAGGQMLSVEESVQSPIVEQSGKRPVFHNDLRVEKRIVVGVLTLPVQGASFFGRESVRHEPFGFSIIRVCRFYGYKFHSVCFLDYRSQKYKDRFVLSTKKRNFVIKRKEKEEMTELLWLFAGGACGAGVVFLWTKARMSSLQTLLQVREEEMEKRRIEMEESVERQSQDFKEREERMENHLAALQERCEALNRENKGLAADKQTLEKELVLVREQMVREGEERNRRFKEQLNLMQEQLQNATREILGQRTRELSQQNTVQMTAIIDPLKETIREMRTAMDSSRDTHNKNTASLEKAIEEVMRRTREIGAEADKLASALRNENKVQGNWGELILDELLESQGLKEGIHYEKQVTLRDRTGKAILNEESGKRMIPDTILHYPDGKDAVIDSKVSLTAFVDYQNDETAEARAEALQRHVRSVRQHVAELARKDYSAYIKLPRQALNYVIMFVPNEGALQLALAEAPELWREAFSKGVFITGEQNLTAALRIIQIAWTQMQQAQNQEAIYDTARMLLDRVADFIAHFETVGQKLQDASSSFTKAADKLKDGRLSVVGAANKLIKLGAKASAKKVIPEENEPLRGVEGTAETGANLPG